MDTEQLKIFLAQLGFDPAMAAHAIIAVPIFRFAAMPAAKLLSFVPKQWEKALAVGITAGIDILMGIGTGNNLAFPVASASMVGAVIAMIVYDLQYKRGMRVQSKVEVKTEVKAKPTTKKKKSSR